jgi:hypothetical protein
MIPPLTCMGWTGLGTTVVYVYEIRKRGGGGDVRLLSEFGVMTNPKDFSPNPNLYSSHNRPLPLFQSLRPSRLNHSLLISLPYPIGTYQAAKGWLTTCTSKKKFRVLMKENRQPSSRRRSNGAPLHSRSKDRKEERGRRKGFFSWANHKLFSLYL